MGRLREKTEPFPWSDKPIEVVGPETDRILTAFFRRRPDLGIIRCARCGRWQEFSPAQTFDEMKAQAQAAGWRRGGVRDLCPVCVGT